MLARLVDCSGSRLPQTPQRGGEQGRHRISFEIAIKFKATIG
jgi:hypothetical protein